MAERGVKDLSEAERWQLLVKYLENSLSHKQIGHLFKLSAKSVESFISTLYQKFQNVREAKVLLNNQNPYNPQFHKVLLAKYVDSEHINGTFLERLSKEEDMLSDYEILYAEFLMEYGDDVRAIERSKLNIGLNQGDPKSYREGCNLRSLYLKRKPNVASYIYDMRKRNLGVLKDGKEYIQSNLIQLIEQLGNLGDKGSLTSQLKAIEQLGRTMGAFEDKVIVENVNGDEVLDRLIARAKEAHLAYKKPVQIEGGGEIYE